MMKVRKYWGFLKKSQEKSKNVTKFKKFRLCQFNFT